MSRVSLRACWPAAGGSSYSMRSICFSLSARMKSGKGMKPTASRYFGALPPSRAIAQSRNVRFPSFTAESYPTAYGQLRSRLLRAPSGHSGPFSRYSSGIRFAFALHAAMRTLRTRQLLSGLGRCRLWCRAAPPHRERRVAGCRLGVALAVRARLAALLHQALGCGVNAKAPGNRRHAPDKIRPATVGASAFAVERCALEGALVARPNTAAGERGRG